ncbi:MAG: hypothetical protein ABI666_08905 [Ferruginibacter sp.]
MKLILSLFSFLVITTSGYAQIKTFSTAVEYNDFIIGEQVKIGEAIKGFISVFTNSTDTIEIQGARKAIVTQADSSVNQLKLLYSFKGDTALKKNAMRLFSFYSKTAANEYKQLVWAIFDAKKTTEEKNKAQQEILKIITDKEAFYDKNFQDAQKAFAAKHHIDLKENEFKVND